MLGSHTCRSVAESIIEHDLSSRSAITAALLVLAEVCNVTKVSNPLNNFLMYTSRASNAAVELVSHTGVQAGAGVDVLRGVSNCSCHWVGATLTSRCLAADELYSWQLLAGANLSARLTSANEQSAEACTLEGTTGYCSDADEL